ncbi:hypothetical protein ACFE04_003424 [Oxalis oulophora]
MLVVEILGSPESPNEDVLLSHRRDICTKEVHNVSASRDTMNKEKKTWYATVQSRLNLEEGQPSMPATMDEGDDGNSGVELTYNFDGVLDAEDEEPREEVRHADLGRDSKPVKSHSRVAKSRQSCSCARGRQRSPLNPRSKRKVVDELNTRNVELSSQVHDLKRVCAKAEDDAYVAHQLVVEGDKALT